MVGRVVGFLVVAAIGIGGAIAGLSWDATQHARDTGLAAREGIFTFANPSHAMLAGGIALAVIGIAGALYWTFDVSSPRAKRSFLAVSTLVALTAVATSSWAFRKEGEHSSPLMKQAAESVALARQANAALTPVPVAAAAAIKGAPQATPDYTIPATADQLMAQTKATAAKYADLQKALADGYTAYTPPSNPIVHYNNFAYMSDGRVVDTARPESLIYANNQKRGWTLIGAMYLLNKAGDKPPHIKPGIRWHAHLDICFKEGTAIMAGSKGEFGGTCPKGTVNLPSAAMLHVWLFDNPEGPFSTDMEPDTMRQIVSE